MTSARVRSRASSAAKAADWFPVPLQRPAVRVSPVAEPPIVDEVLRTPGQPLESTIRTSMEARLGRLERTSDHSHEEAAERVAQRPEPADGPRHDFASVRVHANARANESARAVNALAYTVGDDIVFGAEQFVPSSPAGLRLLAHELAHVVQQRDGGPRLMRAATPDVKDPRTFIVVYGSGQLNPTTGEHNVGALFQRVASQKVAEIKARLGKNVAKHTIVFEYTPTEAELKAVLNRKYAAPVAEIHVFSHGWYEGANLGGQVPPDPKHRPTETSEQAQERRLTKEDLGNYNIAFADDAVATFYGCNIGNEQLAQLGRPFAQQFSEEFGVAVRASTRSTHFESAGGWHQVPDVGGKMKDFAPSAETARSEITRFRVMLQDVKAKRNQVGKTKGGLLGVMIREDRLRNEIVALEAAIEKKRPVVRRLIRFLPPAERPKAEKDIEPEKAP